MTSDATTSPAAEQPLPTGATSPISTMQAALKNHEQMLAVIKAAYAVSSSASHTIQAASKNHEQMLAAIKAAYSVSSSVSHTTRLVAEASKAQDQTRAAVAAYAAHFATVSQIGLAFDAIRQVLKDSVSQRARAAALVQMALDSAVAPALSASSATGKPSPDYLYRTITTMFRDAREERFEDGIATAFSRNLLAFLDAYSNAAVYALERLIESEDTNAEVVAEALRWLPFAKDKASQKYRLNLLEKGLRSTSARIRDAAGLSLAEMNDPRAIPSLEEAIAQESFAELREDLKAVLSQLLKRCPSS